MDPVQVPAVSVPANSSFGFLLVGIGLLCLGLGVRWWWTRTAPREVEESQTDANDENTPSSRNGEEQTADDISGDTGEFVFATDASDTETVNLGDDESADNDGKDHRE